VRPWIGVSGRPVLPPIAALAGIAPAKGVLVAEIYGASPAEKAGLMIGDIILAIDGFPVDEPQALRYRIATRSVGGAVRLSIVRNRSQTQIAVSLTPPPLEPAANETRLSGLSPLAGAKVASLSPALAEDIGLDSAVSGVVVLEVSPGSTADRLGLKAGDIVRVLGDHRVRTVRELLDSRTQAFEPLSVRINRLGQDLVVVR
jgi:serine protease Do